MEYAIIGIVIVAVLAAGMIIFLKSKKAASDIVNEAAVSVEEKAEVRPVPADSELQELVIQMEMLPAEAITDKSKLVEITDSKVLAHINNLVPGLAQVSNVVNCGSSSSSQR